MKKNITLMITLGPKNNRISRDYLVTDAKGNTQTFHGMSELADVFETSKGCLHNAVKTGKKVRNCIITVAA